MVEMFEVTGSSRLTQFGYDAETATVYVRFTNGALWSYQCVPAEVWEEFVRASSKGRFITEVLDRFEHGQADF